MNTHVWWYLARSSGIVAWGLLTASVVLGLVLSTRALGRRPAPAWTADLHRGIGGMAVTFTALHLLGLIADSTVEFGVADLLVPFASTWRPGAVAWGILSFYLLAAVEVSSLLRRRLSTRLWRWIHLTSFLLYIVATAHLLTSGTDASSPWLLWPVWATMVAIASLTLVRVLLPRGRARRTTRAPERARPAARRPAAAETVTTRVAAD
jgi:DMSO/TMAO reductase YedYZ heme-binding membrane subunit